MWISPDGNLNTVDLESTYYSKDEQLRDYIRALKRKHRNRLEAVVEAELTLFSENLHELSEDERAPFIGNDETFRARVPISILNAVDWPRVISSKPDFATIRAVDMTWRLDIVTYLDVLLSQD
jgi:hypothetical protein